MSDSNQNSDPGQDRVITSLEEINRLVKQKDVGYASHFYVPSLGKEIPFGEINTAQQKRLVKSVIDSPIYHTEFIYTLRGIMQENCQDPDVSIDNLTLIDKLIIALSMRIKSIGETVDVEVETKDGAEVKVTLQLPDILELAINGVEQIDDIVLEDDYFKIVCSVPTIGNEYTIEKELRDNVTDIDIDNVEELRETVGDAFTGELVKYIKQVSIKDAENNTIAIDWTKFNTTDRIKVIETFKASLLSSVIKYINSIREQIDKIELVSFEFGGEKYERRLTLDGGFFTIS